MKEKAEKELEKYRCEYIKMREDYEIVEYALEYSEHDEDGFIVGSDYDLASEIRNKN